MFADTAGFTARSSTREPSQVFTLLESVYHDVDVIAKHRRVFKVEVVGDCYVAVAWLPDPRPVSCHLCPKKISHHLHKH
jgi:class 3 adenylate cyclase